MSDYKKYKSKLREEFSFACAYCETREPELGGAQSFHIDHYKPKSKFPELRYSYTNLIYACRNCNQYKGSFWPTLAHSILGKVIFNPRPLGNIRSHIDTSSSKWTGKTNSGRWSIKKLRLDGVVLIKRRENRDLVEKSIERLENIYYQNQQNLTKAIEENLDKTTIDIIKSDLSKLKEEISVIRSRIEGAMD